uniref:Uncharacterized protein n=1 Tax=Glossina pallidipes TaxID=7398 RepID=A0A1A9ZJ36_GLOPL
MYQLTPCLFLEEPESGSSAVTVTIGVFKSIPSLICRTIAVLGKLGGLSFSSTTCTDKIPFKPMSLSWAATEKKRSFTRVDSGNEVSYDVRSNTAMICFEDKAGFPPSVAASSTCKTEPASARTDLYVLIFVF